MSKPVYRITFSRKDGEDITFTNYKGEEVTKKYAPLGALFERERGEGLTLLVDSAAKGHKVDAEKYWYNVYPVDRDDEPRRGQQSRKPQSGKKQSRQDDDGALDF